MPLMRAAVMRKGQLIVDDVPDPVPGPGQALVRTLACGICGSDLHFLKYGQRMVDLSKETTGVAMLDLGRDVVMGHEFSAEVLELGPDAAGPKPGTVVTSMPVMLNGFSMEDIRAVGYSNEYPGGYSERMLLSAPMLLEVPNGLDPRLAALTEPMAVGAHAVVKSGITPGETAVVLGCGPVGLAVVAALSLAGIEPIVAADFSPARRQLATTMGAHEVVDPREEPAIEAWRRVDGVRNVVLFEAVGVPGMIQAAMKDAPRWARILVVGVCMEDDSIVPMYGINKELEIRFALGYMPNEFADTLNAIAEGKVDVAPLITSEVDLDGVPGAFDALADPEEQCKILVRP
jgi:threonine dehydrogenase-like Zn-dependent dehydrogenase